MKTLTWIVLLAACQLSMSAEAATPNVVFIVADDMGYADLGVQGAKGFRTPHLDQLAADGTRFTNFYVAQSVCTASRTALMTGCYPNRLGMYGAYNHTSRDGIADTEWLLPEMFQERGYATAGIGVTARVARSTTEMKISRPLTVVSASEAVAARSNAAPIRT